MREGDGLDDDVAAPVDYPRAPWGHEERLARPVGADQVHLGRVGEDYPVEGSLVMLVRVWMRVRVLILANLT